MVKPLLCVLSILWVVGCTHTAPPLLKPSGGYVGKLDATWSAWTNEMPPGPRSLHVVGEVTLSNGRYSAIVEPSDETPGKHCKITIREVSGVGTTALKDQKVHLVYTKYNGNDEKITVHFPDGTTLDVPIESVH